MRFIKNDSAQSNGLGILGIMGILGYLAIVVIMELAIFISWSADIILKLLVMFVIGIIVIIPVILKLRSLNSE